LNDCGGEKPEEIRKCLYVATKEVAEEETEQEETPEQETVPEDVESLAESIPEEDEDMVNETIKPNLITGAVVGVGNAIKSGWGIGIIVLLALGSMLFFNKRKQK